MIWKWISIIYHLLLSLISILFLLYTFVIPHGGSFVSDPETFYLEHISEYPDLSYGNTHIPLLDQSIQIGYYESPYVLITLYQVRLYDSDIYIADVVVRDPKVILTAFANQRFGGHNYLETVSHMAEKRDAIFAINSDHAEHYNQGIVIRNGQILRDSLSYRKAFVLWENGSMSSIIEQNTSAQQLSELNAWQVWSFGPPLVNHFLNVARIDDGYIRNEVDNPRTALGWVEDYRYMFVVIDGRTQKSRGVDIVELASIMVMLGCQEAYNLDGGGSSTMVFDGRVINTPSGGKERKVGDCVYIIG